ncbi:MAG: hypothetical protein COU25_00350 [Candidatus Levybacteria bacterium CG10_big_fil_rev_8_21_14_0_10_35_13]|nr:MAG: hypothetical protein COU25_00350 [Candidatus Levybacteria bacterium CG10_big_fil_rev_8_21_14_0_10_35_13]
MTDGIFGPFENPDDINKYWYQVTEKELEEYIEKAKKDSENSDNSKEDTKIYKQDVEMWSKELKDLRNFLDDYARSIERYKFDKKILQRIQDDWKDYNLSLYADYCRMKASMLDSDMLRGEGLKAVRNEAKLEKIKREEIEKRIKDLLST